MGIVKPVLTIAILMSSLICNNAWAGQAAPAPAPEPELKQNKPTPPKKPIKRRAVQQVIDGMPAPPAPQVYGPRLSAPTPPATYAPILPSTVPSGMAPLPAVLNRCDAGGCTDTAGARYNNGVGTTLLSPQGRLCSNNGLTVSCF